MKANLMYAHCHCHASTSKRACALSSVQMHHETRHDAVLLHAAGLVWWEDFSLWKMIFHRGKSWDNPDGTIQESYYYTRILLLYKTLATIQESCYYTRVLLLCKNPTTIKESYYYTRILHMIQES